MPGVWKNYMRKSHPDKDGILFLKSKDGNGLTVAVTSVGGKQSLIIVSTNKEEGGSRQAVVVDRKEFIKFCEEA